MTVKANEKPFVVELPVYSKDVVRAYLYNFEINKHSLAQEHRDWLERELVSRMTFLSVGKKEYWHSWIMGSTSQTGKSQHNLALSKRRAQSVDAYLRKAFEWCKTVNDSPGSYRSDLTWVGEFSASFSRIPEDPADRSVLVMFALAGPQDPPPPKVIKPITKFQIPCCYAKLEIAYLQAAKDAWTQSMGALRRDTGNPRVAKVDQSHFVSALKSNGYSHSRAMDLYLNGPLTTAPIEHAKRMTSDIGNSLGRAKENLVNCSEADPAGLCDSCSYSRTTSKQEQKIIKLIRQKL